MQNLRLLDETVRAFFTPLQQNVSRRRGGAPNQPAAVAPASGGAGDRDHNVGACNEEELHEFKKKVRILASDGGSGERRGVFLAAEKYFPNVQFVIEDPAHGLRIATVKPLQLES